MVLPTCHETLAVDRAQAANKTSAPHLRAVVTSLEPCNNGSRPSMLTTLSSTLRSTLDVTLALHAKVRGF